MMSGSGREALSNVREWSGDPPGCTGLVERPSPDRSRTTWRASRPVPDIHEGLPTTPGHPGEPPDHSRTSWRASRPVLDIREGLPTTPGHSGGPSDHSRTSRWASQSLPDIREGRRTLHKITSTYKKQNKKTLPPPPSASCKTSAHFYVCILVNVWLIERKNTTSASCSGQQQDECKSCVPLDNALVGTRKTPPAQVAEGQDHLGH